METGFVNLKLDKEWDMDELSVLSKLYVQCYSLVYSLSGFEIKSNDARAIDWFQGAYAKYPWRGGFSTINFYHELYAKIPFEQRPSIKEIQYASPGYIKLKEVLIVAGCLAAIVAAVTSSIDNIHKTYNTIQKGLSERKLAKLEVELTELKLEEARLEYMADSTMKCNFCKEVYRQAAVVSELLKRPSKRSTDEALQAAHQGATIPDFRFEESGIEPIANCG